MKNGGPAAAAKNHCCAIRDISAGRVPWRTARRFAGISVCSGGKGAGLESGQAGQSLVLTYE